MLIFPKQIQPLKVSLSWQAELKQSLISKCKAFIKSNHLSPIMIEKPKLWYYFCNNQRFQEHHDYDLVDHGHGHYSEYVSISSNQYQSNQFSDYFHFIRHLFEQHNADYEINLFQISNTVQTSKNYLQWMQICKKYLIDLTVQEMFYYYHLLLVKGVSLIKKIIQNKGITCKKQAFLYKILEINRFSHEGTRINSHMIVSIDKGQQITLQNLSKTLKYLFCSICMIYDCQRHFLPTCAIKNNFQYIKQYDIRHRLENRKRSAQKLFQQILFIANNTQSEDISFCSEKCFKKLSQETWKKLKLQRKRKIFSPVFKGLTKMGVQLYYYNPCAIQILFSNDNLSKNAKDFQQQTSCQQIFYYFIHEYNLLQKMQFKFYQTEEEQLINESMNTVCLLHTVSKKPIKKFDKTSKKDECDEYNSICFHYFLDKQPNDATCLSCDCQIRGYCLPTCGCSELCEIRRVGCRCKRESNCWENKCPCFKSNLVCLPQICENCIKDDEHSGRINWCQNNEKCIHKNKLTRIGKSNIQDAGLGLFAGEPIFKGEFVMKYLGEVIDSVSLQKIRETLVQNNLFYNFKLSQYQSVDSRIYGNKARFINHSKKLANLIPRSMRINEENVIVFHATKQIQQGEELYFNYNGEGQLSEFKQKFPFID